MMNHRIAGGIVLAAVAGVLLVSVSMAEDDSPEVKRLSSEEQFFLHAAGLLVKEPEKLNDLVPRIQALSERNLEKWAGDDIVLKALVSIEEKAPLRKRYRESLEKLLDGDPKVNSKKLIEKIKADFTPGKTQEYRVVIAKADGGKLTPGSLPWPLCIPFDCCR